MNFVHETSIVEEGAQIGDGTKIWHFCHVMPSAKIGDKSQFGQNCFIDNNVIIGNNVKVQNNVSIYNGVIIEDDVFIGPSVVFTNVLNPRAFIEQKQNFRSTLVAKGATIGANATIVCGVTLGAYCFIGAGAVVTREVKPFAMITGNPGIQTGWVDKRGQKLTLIKNTATDIFGNTYSEVNGNLIFKEL